MNEQVHKIKMVEPKSNHCENLDSEIQHWITRNREKLESMKEEEDCAAEIMHSPAKRLIGQRMQRKIIKGLTSAKKVQICETI